MEGPNDASMTYVFSPPGPGPTQTAGIECQLSAGLAHCSGSWGTLTTLVETVAPFAVHLGSTLPAVATPTGKSGSSGASVTTRSTSSTSATSESTTTSAKNAALWSREIHVGSKLVGLCICAALCMIF